MHDADADADVLLSTKSPTSTYVNAPIQFSALSSVMIVAVMIPLCQMKQQTNRWYHNIRTINQILKIQRFCMSIKTLAIVLIRRRTRQLQD